LFLVFGLAFEDANFDDIPAFKTYVPLM